MFDCLRLNKLHITQTSSIEKGKINDNDRKNYQKTLC